jgi:3-phosphoshikimate 1-carboxyvinyltransferase
MPHLIIHPSGPLRGSVIVPGDKSISHRALLLAALAEDDTWVRGWLPAEDCQATLRCARALGVNVEEKVLDPQGLQRPCGSGAADLLVHGVGLRGLAEPADVLDCGGSGTTMRLLAGILAGQPFTSVLTGSQALRRRPMGRVVEPLRLMGATVLGRDGGRLPPLAIRGGDLRGIDYPMPVASAQVKSAILLAGLFAEGETIVREPGPARDHTERMLRQFGVEMEILAASQTRRACPELVEGVSENPSGLGRAIRLPDGQTLTGLGGTADAPGLVVPGDISSAAFLLVAAAIVPRSEVQVHGVGVNPTRTGLLDLLAAMGAEFDVLRPSSFVGEPTADLLVRCAPLRGVEAGGEVVVRAIDEFPILAVAATQAEGITTIRDAAELRVKESDRISAVAMELTKMGARVEEQPDGLIIHGPTQLGGASVEAHHDHRLAMALAVAGLVARGETVIHGAEAIGDSFPGFVETMQALGADVAWRE